MQRIPSEASLGGKSSPRHSSVGSSQNLTGLAAAHNSNSDLLAAGMSANQVDDRPIVPMPGTGGTGAFETRGIEMEAVGLELSFDGVEGSAVSSAATAAEAAAAGSVGAVGAPGVSTGAGEEQDLEQKQVDE